MLFYSVLAHTTVALIVALGLAAAVNLALVALTFTRRDDIEEIEYYAFPPHFRVRFRHTGCSAATTPANLTVIPAATSDSETPSPTVAQG